LLINGDFRQVEQLRRGEIITEKEVKELCEKATEILIEESNVQKVDSPVTVNKPSLLLVQL
jgi:serine/threonine-protein phosphatase 4 catalytic subunit